MSQLALAADAEIHFDVAAGDFAQAVVEFSKQSHIEILYVSKASVEGIKTRGVSGTFTAAAALDRLLNGTGFEREFENPGSVLLRAAPIPSETAVGSAPSLPGLVDIKAAALAAARADVKPESSEVIITGSYLHGAVDAISPLRYVTQQQMTEAPYATVQDALQTLPVNLLSGQSDNFGGAGNFNRGSGPNLRGLGFGATLVLVDGRRQPGSGTSADFVDVANIPWSIIDHIEILPDGASSLYGSDAIAGVVNVILRKHLQGAETHLRGGLTPDGAQETMAAQLFGTQWDGGNVLLAYQYFKRGSLAATDRRYAANADKSVFGGSDFRSQYGNPGNILNHETFEPMGIPLGQDGKGLQLTDLLSVANLSNPFAQLDLVPNNSMHSVYATASQQLGDRARLFADVRFSQRDTDYRNFPVEQILYVPEGNAFNTFKDQPYTYVSYNFSRDFGTPHTSGRTRSGISTVGIEQQLRGDWQANLSASYGAEQLRGTTYNVVDNEALNVALASNRAATAFNPFGDGSYTNSDVLQSIRTTSLQGARSSIRSLNLVTDGSLFAWSAGEARLAVGGEYRQERLANDQMLPSRVGRNVGAAFAEMSLPLIGKADDQHAAPRLELSLTGRYENYSDFGHAFNPKIGLRFVPLEWMRLRGSWGTSFHAPKLVDLYNTYNDANAVIVLPSPDGPTLVGAMQGSNPDLSEETASTWTAGVDFASERLPGFELALTYFDVTYENQVIQPGPLNPFEILFHETEWTSVINRQPTARQRDELCSSPNLYNPDKQTCLESPLAAIVDIRMSNLATTRTNGLDLKLVHALETPLGRFDFAFDGTQIFSFRRALTSTSASMDVLNTVNYPLSTRLRTSLGWSQSSEGQQGFGARLTLTHTGGYRDDESPLLHSVAAWNTLDMQLRYRSAEGDGTLDDIEYVINAVNVLNRAPPFVDQNYGYDKFNALPYGRVISLYLRKSWQ